MGGFKIVGKSIAYACTHKKVLICILIGVVISLLLTFLFDQGTTSSNSIYFYESVKTFVLLVWAVWLATFVMHSFRHDSLSLAQSLRLAVKNSFSAWWFVVWIIILDSIFIFSYTAPKSYGETPLVLLFFGTMGLGIFQRSLNFFMVPLIADGVTSITIAIPKAFVYLVRNILRVLAVVIAMAIVGIIIFMAYGFCDIFIQMLLEKLFVAENVRVYMKLVLTQFFSITTYGLLIIAQVILYLQIQKKENMLD